MSNKLLERAKRYFPNAYMHKDQVRILTQDGPRAVYMDGDKLCVMTEEQTIRTENMRPCYFA